MASGATAVQAHTDASTPSDDSSMTMAEASGVAYQVSAQGTTPRGNQIQQAASFLTQSVKKQPRSPRDKQASPKRARVGAGVEVDEQDDTSSTEPGLLLEDVVLQKAEPGAHQDAADEMAGPSNASVFSPVFQCMRTLRTSLDHTQHEQEQLQQVDESSQVDAPHQLAPWMHVDDTLLMAAGLEPQGDQQEALEHGHELHHPGGHHIIPEAVEHELPPDASADVEEELDYMDFDPLLFIKLLPPLDQVVPKHRPMLLPRKTRMCKQKTLVLDLDETLVHSCLEAQAVSDFTFPVHFNSQEHIIHVRQRPHLHTFMHRVAELFEVVVFTASQKIYAEKLLNIIDPDRKLITHRIFRESCVVVEGNYLKDLTALGRDLRNTLIVDNSPQAFGFQVDNGVPIESWYDDMADTELLKLLPFLESIVSLDDVRPAIRNKFKMRELIDRVVC